MTIWQSGNGEAGALGGGGGLWQALDAMRIEPEGAALTFSARLARENGWSQAHAEAVFREYKRFLFLAAHSPQPVTPSQDVDQAWHLHLLYSRHYWDVLCGQILGRPLHHGPTGGGPVEGVRYRRQYEGTLDRYRSAFGGEPPPAIWPPVDLRFAARALWVDRRQYWLVPKALGGRVLLGGGAALLAACSAATAGASDGEALHFVLFLAVFLILATVAATSWAKTRNRRENEQGGGGCGGGSGCESGESRDSSVDGGGSDAGGDGGGGCGGGGCGGGCGGS